MKALTTVDERGGQGRVGIKCHVLRHEVSVGILPRDAICSDVQIVCITSEALSDMVALRPPPVPCPVCKRCYIVMVWCEGFTDYSSSIECVAPPGWKRHRGREQKLMKSLISSKWSANQRKFWLLHCLMQIVMNNVKRSSLELLANSLPFFIILVAIT